MQWLAIGLGAALGACFRAWLAKFNTLHAWIPFGTLSANILGGLLIGMALIIFERLSSQNIGLSVTPHLKFFIITGFLGGLTTFSSFSAEVFALINAGKLLAGLLLIGMHVLMTLVATAIGYYFIKLVW